MTKEQILKFKTENPITYNSIRIDFKDNTYTVGFFEIANDSSDLEKQNKWRFVTNNKAIAYRESKSIKPDKSIEHTIIINGDSISKISLL